MPFIGKDWRDPGDKWERSSGGWKPLKKNGCTATNNENNTIRNIAKSTNVHQSERTINSRHSDEQEQQPHINFVKGTAKTRKIHLSLSESLIQLRMSAAPKDSTKFLYVYKMIRHLVSMKWDKISGTVQKMIFNMLETMVIIAIEQEMHINMMMELVQIVVKTLNVCHHSYPGSLWNRHIQTVNRMIVDLDNFTYQQRNDDEEPILTDLPKECIHKILSLLSDHRDLIHLGMTNSFLCNMAQDHSLWKQLCRFHFGPKQLFDYLPSEFEDGDIDWTDSFKMAVKKYGQKESYTDNLVICRNCRILYWKCLGHPCRSEERTTFEFLSPEDFIDLFHL